MHQANLLLKLPSFIDGAGPIAFVDWWRTDACRRTGSPASPPTGFSVSERSQIESQPVEEPGETLAKLYAVTRLQSIADEAAKLLEIQLSSEEAMGKRSPGTFQSLNSRIGSRSDATCTSFCRSCTYSGDP